MTLRATYIGYRPTTQAVQVGDTLVRLVLEETAINLEELVVTGTAPGATEKRAIGTVVARVPVEQLTEFAPAPNLDQLLNARAAGVTFLSGAGDVNTGSYIRIRGLSSLSLSNSPILYIDGVRADNEARTGSQTGGTWNIGRINDISPQEIESIEIIKGPAAATLYGTEASAGVIQIITKKGRRGRSRVSAEVSQGANWLPDPEGRFPTGYLRRPDGSIDSLNFVQYETDLGYPLFRTGHRQDYALEATGGNETIQYFATAGFKQDEGVFRSNQQHQFNGRVNLTAQVTDKLDMAASAGYVTGRTQPGGNSISTPMNCAFYPYPAYKDDPLTKGCAVPVETWFNIWDRSQGLNRTTLSLTVNYRPFTWLTNRAIVGTDLVDEEDATVVERFGGPEAVYFGSTADGFAAITGRRKTNLTFDYSGTISHDIVSHLNSKTSFGVQYFKRLGDVLSASGSGFPAPGVRSITSAATRSVAQTNIDNATLGFFVQQQFGWRNRLFLTGALRADDNSAFGQEFDVVIYPKLSATWVVSEEPFWNVGLVNTLRLRAAYGQSGQQPLAYSALQTYQPFVGPGDRSTLRPQFFGNPDLGPERGEEVELGLDAGLLDDHLGVEFTYYHKSTKDAILNRTVPPSLGFAGSQPVNIGEVRNTGVELSIDAVPLQRRGLRWELGLNFATNSNKIVSMGGIPPVSLFLRQQHREGFPIAAWFDRKVVSADIDASGTAVNLMCDGGRTVDGIAGFPGGPATPCSEAPAIYLGQNIPRQTGALSTTLTLFDRLTLYGMMDFKLDYEVFDAGRTIRCTLAQFCLETIDPDAARVNPLATAEMQNNIWGPHTSFYDAGFAKLRQVSATYRLPDSWARVLGASAGAMTLSGRNLKTWTNWLTLDPEVRDIYDQGLSGTSNGTFNQQMGNVPLPVQVVFSLRLTY